MQDLVTIKLRCEDREELIYDLSLSDITLEGINKRAVEANLTRGLNYTPVQFWITRGQHEKERVLSMGTLFTDHI